MMMMIINWDLTFINGKVIQQTKLGITLADVTQELYRTLTYLFSPKISPVSSPLRTIRKS